MAEERQVEQTPELWLRRDHSKPCAERAELTRGSVEGMRAAVATMGTCWRGSTSYSSGISWRQELTIRTFASMRTLLRPDR